MKILPNTINFLKLVTAAFILAALPINTIVADEIGNMEARIESLEKELAQMRTLLEQSMNNSVTREEVQELKKEVQVTRANQDEWKTYDSKVHLAGYAAVGYSDNSLDNDSFNQVQFNPIFHYGYKDLLLLESELEVEIEDGETHVELEYLTVDWFINDYVTLLGGKFLSPLGQFQQNLHPAWINKLPSVPAGFAHEGAQPTAEVGAQLRGGFHLAMVNDTSLVNYAVYVGNGPQLEIEEEDGEFEIHAIETEGFTEDEDDEKVFGGRIGFLPIPNLEIGFSGASGNVALEDESERDYDVLGVDLFYRWQNLDLRAEYVKQEVGDLATSIAPEGQWWEAWYTQASYKLLPTKFELVARYSDLNSTHASQEQEQWALGINYLIANHGMVKLAYEINDGLTGRPTDENRFLLQLTYGF